MNTNELIDNALSRGAKKLPDSIAEIDRHFCGCGSPDIAWKWILDYLGPRADGLVYQAIDTGCELIAVYLMDHLGLTDHGTSINGAWITDRGREVVQFLRQNTVNWDETGEWVGSDGCSYGLQIDFH